MFPDGYLQNVSQRWLVIAGTLFVLSAMSQAQNWTWTAETVDPSGTFSSLAIDVDGNVHVGYLSPDGGGTKYAFRDHTTGRWDSMVVDKNNGLVSLALDSQQRPHLCYMPYLALKYASWDGKNWQIQEIAPHSGEREFSCGIAIGSDGSPHISWYQYRDKEGQLFLHIRHAVLKDGAWQARTLDLGHETGKWKCTRVDAQGRVYVSYSAFRDHAFRFARFDPAAGWTTTTVEDGALGRRVETTPGMGNSMVLDKNGNPNFSFRDESTLRFAWPEGDHWRIDVVDPNANPFENLGWINQRTSVALDAAGYPHIAYETDGLLKHAWWDGTKWHVQSMGIQGDNQRYASLAISKDNVIYIGYSDPQDGSLKVLVGRLSQPSDSPVTSQPRK